MTIKALVTPEMQEADQRDEDIEALLHKAMGYEGGWSELERLRLIQRLAGALRLLYTKEEKMSFEITPEMQFVYKFHAGEHGNAMGKAACEYLRDAVAEIYKISQAEAHKRLMGDL